MIKPNEEIVHSIANLESNPNWKRICQWIEDSLYAQSINNNKLTGELTIKGQGRGLELEELITYISKTPEYLELFKRNKK
jgi:hypothetical protein